MSRKMIDYQVDNGKISTIDGYNVGGVDEEELNAKIQEATTTKQDKLYTKTNSGITLTEEEGKSYISSELVYKQITFTANPFFYKGTYKPGDVVASITYQIDGEMFIGEANIGTDASRVVQWGDVITVRKVYISPGSGGTKTRIIINWIAINNGTLSEDKQLLQTPLGIIVAVKAKRT